MAISNVNISSPSSSTIGSVFNNTTPTPADKTQTSTDSQPSTVVTLSSQGQKLSQAQSGSSPSSQSSQNTQSTQSQSTTKAAANETIESVPKEANEAPGIQFMEGENKGGRISTYA